MISVDRDEEGRLKDGKNVLEVQNVTKKVGSLIANRDVTFNIG